VFSDFAVQEAVIMLQHKWRALLFSGTVGAAAVGLLLPTSVYAKSCSAEIDRTQMVVDAVLAKRAQVSPWAPESTFATMNRQPTPATIAKAENEYGGWASGAKAIKALRNARAAEAAGNSQTCLSELRTARRAISGQ
jgi:hypothetical protein